MTRKAGAKVPLRMDVSAATKQRLADLRDRTDAESMTAVFRRSLALYEFLTERLAQGDIIVCRDADGVERELVVLP